MDKEQHNKISNIIAKVIDLPREDAKTKIKKLCDSDKDLEKEVLLLYNEIQGEEVIEKNESIKPVKEITKLIGRKDSAFRTKIVTNWTKQVFGNKRNRLILVILFLIVTFGLGVVSNLYIRDNILESEREEKIALLNTTSEIFKRWVLSEKNKIENLSKDSKLIAMAKTIDSLENIDETYGLLKKSDVAKEVTKWLLKSAKNSGYPILSIVSNSSPKSILGSGLIDSTGITKMFNIDLGQLIYKDYLKAKSGETVFIPPVNNYDLIHNFELKMQDETWVNFFCPIMDEQSNVLAILVGSSLAKNGFSEIFNTSKHGATSETYAFNNDGKMISSGRFTKELRKTYLLEDTLETIYNIELKDPGLNVMLGAEPSISSVEMPFTNIVDTALNHIKLEDSVYNGSIMKPYRDYRGIEVIGAYLWYPEHNFGLITEEDFDEALASLVYFRYTFFIFFIIILVLSFLLFNSNVRIARIGKKVDDFSIIGQYKLREKLGEGGFGEVFKAEHTFLKTPVAIKILKNQFANTDSLERFEKEVKITSSLSHPNTIKVYDYGTTESDNFYYVMEFLNGISLDKVVNSENEIPLARGIYVLYHLCLSLKEAHDKGFAHRDIKPMNVMLCNQGGAYDVVKLLDFGLVKNVDASMTQQTQINRIGGTPMFMAPERIRDPFNADLRVDIYSIGALGMYLFSGQYLLELVSQKMLTGEETLQGDFRNNLIARTDVPNELNEFLAACIRFDPNKRPNSIDDLIAFFEKLNQKNPWTRKDALSWWKNYDVYS